VHRPCGVRCRLSIRDLCLRGESRDGRMLKRTYDINQVWHDEEDLYL